MTAQHRRVAVRLVVEVPGHDDIAARALEDGGRLYRLTYWEPDQRSLALSH
jgi:hypothetical protein